MKTIFKYLFFLCLIFCSLAFKPVPADPRPHVVIQANGKTLTYYVKGDERTHWIESSDGYTLLYNDNKELEFACIDEHCNLLPSGVLACDEQDRDETELSLLETIEKRLFFIAKDCKN
ncbi:MAG: hypothetical protein IJ180_05295 [Bacteroidales bacterium]|nr:hypothetical protein [Bacteroidales bacterium]